jgi:dipeptidyl aminopeptidase/acylaminoacyl peptidase
MPNRTVNLLGPLVAAMAVTGSIHAQTPNDFDILSIDQLLSIESVLGGAAPQWSPDGARILFSSGLAGGGLMTLSPDGGFPTRVPLNLGGAGHFLASQWPDWSPGGEWISYVSDKSGSTEIWLWSMMDGQEIQLTNLGARIGTVSWAPNGRWITFSGDRYGNMDVWKVAVPGGEVERLTTEQQYEVYPAWTPDSRRIVYVRLDDRWADHHVIEISANGENPRVVLEDRDFFDYGAGSKFGFPSVSPDGSTILFRSHRTGWINYWVAPLAGGEPRRLAPAAADQSEAMWSPDGHYVLYVENHNGTHDLRMVPARGGEPRVLVSPSMGVVSKPDWSPDAARISYVLATPTRPADLYTIDVASQRVTQLTTSMPEGGFGKRLTVPEKITYPSSDGFVISAYLYRPERLRPEERVPGVMWIHGGPTSQFNDTFQQHVQFFVDRGFAVLLPNIRGSSGYGKTFEDANNRCWSHCDLEDVLAGADYLRALPYVDPDRTGITGTSYGGIMSMAAAAFAPGAFEAAIPASGYCDWISFYHGENELRHIKLLEYELGNFDTSADVWRAASAITGVADVATPLFLLHGEGRYPGSPQSGIFARALENHYKPFRYEVYSGETYYVRGRQNRRQMLLEMLEFFDQFLRDGATSTDRVDDTRSGQ